MAGDYFVFVIFNRSDRDGCQQTLREDAPHKLLHLRIIFHQEGMSLKGPQLFDRQLHGLRNIQIIQCYERFNRCRQYRTSDYLLFSPDCLRYPRL